MSEAALFSVVKSVGIRTLVMGLAVLHVSGCGQESTPAAPAVAPETKAADLPIVKAAAKGKAPRVKVTDEDTSAHLRRKNAQEKK